MQSDLDAIAEGQLKEMHSKCLESKNDSIILFDTDLLTIYIWDKDKFSPPLERLHDLMVQNWADVYLLCKPDIEWQDDPLREDANRRDELFLAYEKTLQEHKRTYHIIEGNGSLRTRLAIQIVKEYQ